MLVYKKPMTQKISFILHLFWVKEFFSVWGSFFLLENGSFRGPSGRIQCLHLWLFSSCKKRIENAGVNSRFGTSKSYNLPYFQSFCFHAAFTKISLWKSRFSHFDHNSLHDPAQPWEFCFWSHARSQTEKKRFGGFSDQNEDILKHAPFQCLEIARSSLKENLPPIKSWQSAHNSAVDALIFPAEKGLEKSKAERVSKMCVTWKEGDKCGVWQILKETGTIFLDLTLFCLELNSSSKRALCTLLLHCRYLKLHIFRLYLHIGL